MHYNRDCQSPERITIIPVGTVDSPIFADDATTRIHSTRIVAEANAEVRRAPPAGIPTNNTTFTVDVAIQFHKIYTAGVGIEERREKGGFFIGEMPVGTVDMPTAVTSRSNVARIVVVVEVRRDFLK